MCVFMQVVTGDDEMTCDTHSVFRTTEEDSS